MADREFEEEAYIYLGREEIFQVDKIVVRDGAYISILKNLSDPTKVKIVCRGTAMRRSAKDGLKSGLNDLQYEIGNGGIQGAWLPIEKYLNDKKIKEVEVYGKSLGGAHAQRLAILVMTHSECVLKGITTVCSVGVGSEAELLFNKLFEEKKEYQGLSLTVIRNGGEDDGGADYIPCIGGDHLGATVNSQFLNLKVYYVHPKAKEIFPPNRDLKFFQKGLRFVSSFSGPHLAQSTLKPNFSYKLLGDKEGQSALKMGNDLERPRRWLAYKNKRSFTDFVNDPSTVATDLSAKKVILVASTVFLALFLIGFVTCLALQPGTIVYHGDAFIVTLPAIAMAGGAGLSLMAIALGSCSWWISTRKTETPLLN